MARHKGRGYEPHVRLYAHEMRVPAWHTLDPDARSLLIEMRSLYAGKDNRVFMSVREIMRRLNIGQRRAQRALDALIQREWIIVIEKGAFHRKVKHATVFALGNEPLEDRDGATAPKGYMRWRPSEIDMEGNDFSR